MVLAGLPPPASDNTAVRLLRAACVLAGGEEALARRLETSVPLLRKYLHGRNELPQSLLLRTVDLLLESQSGPAFDEGAPEGAASRDGSDLPA